jgi:cytochrome oxidase assembly protein ShyY1
VRDGEMGFEVITPFYCYKDENGQEQAVLIDRGWVTKEWSDFKKHWEGAMGPQTINAIVFKGDGDNKYSKNNEGLHGTWNTVKPKEIATNLLLNNRELSGQFLLKQIELDPNENHPFPRMLNALDVEKFPIDAQTNMNYSSFWYAATFLNIFGNMFVWLYL